MSSDLILVAISYLPKCTYTRLSSRGVPVGAVKYSGFWNIFVIRIRDVQHKWHDLLWLQVGSRWIGRLLNLSCLKNKASIWRRKWNKGGTFWTFYSCKDNIFICLSLENACRLELPWCRWHLPVPHKPLHGMSFTKRILAEKCQALSEFGCNSGHSCRQMLKSFIFTHSSFGF